MEELLEKIESEKDKNKILKTVEAIEKYIMLYFNWYYSAVSSCMQFYNNIVYAIRFSSVTEPDIFVLKQE